MATLKTDCVDAVLNTSYNEKRKFTQTTNTDNTVSFDDSTVYATEGTKLNAELMNATNTQVNTNTADISNLKTNKADASVLGTQVTYSLSGSTLTITVK